MFFEIQIITTLFMRSTPKLLPVLGSSTPVLGMNMKQGKSIVWLFLQISLSTPISMKRSYRKLFIDVVVARGVLKNNEITLFHCFTFMR